MQARLFSRSAFIAIPLLSFLVTGCNSDDSLDFTCNPEETVPNPVESTSTAVDQTEALKVANAFLGISNPNQSRSTSNAEITTLTSEDGNEIIYVVNFSDDNGFVLLSTDKKQPPVLGFSDEGRFDLSSIDNSGATEWITFASDFLTKVNQSEEEILDNQTLWNLYLAHSDQSAASRSGNDVSEQLNAAIQEWVSNGWNYYEAKYYYGNGSLSYFPLDLVNELNQIANDNSNYYLTGRPLIEDTYIVEWTESTINASTSNILTTKWGQGYPYNTALITSYPNATYLGCTAVASGQILKYKADLAGYDFSKMPDKATYSSSNEVARFLFDVGNAIGIAYKDSQSGATPNQVLNGMKSLGYTNSKLVSCSFLDLFNVGYPIYVRGTDSSIPDSGHAWVVDGSRAEYYVTHYMIMVPNEHPEDAMGGPYVPYHWNYNGYSKSSAAKYLHCNWGWDGKSDGYFMAFKPEGYSFTNIMYINIQ